jgi:hypothetical protein
MNNSFDNIERYGDDLNDVTGMDDFGVPSRSGNRGWFLPIILLGGLLTTALVFVALYFLNVYTGQNFLALLINYVIPIGAVVGGLIAGIGYAVAARIVQFYPEKLFFLFIFFLQFALFFVARYMEYSVYWYHTRSEIREFEEFLKNATDENGNKIEIDRDKIEEAIKIMSPSFVDFYRFQIEETEWTSKNNKEPFKMGKWGWAIEFLTAFVFALCSLAASGVLALSAYCRLCRRFMSSKLEFSFPMRAPKRKIKKNDEADLEAFRQEEAEAIAYAAAKIAKIEAFLKTEQATNRSEVFQFLCEIYNEIISEAKPMTGIPNSVRVTYSECGSCDNFLLLASIVLLDVNNKTAFQATDLLRFTNGTFVTTAVPMPSV